MSNTETHIRCQSYDPITLSELSESIRRSPLSTAFVIGQMLNRYGFHAQQAFFFPCEGDHSRARELTVQLSLLARNLVPSEQRDTLEGDLRNRCEAINYRIGTDAHRFTLWKKCHDLKQMPQPDFAFVNLTEVREDMLGELFGELSQIRDMIETTLSGEVRLAYRLGKHIDQGMCPEDIYRDLDNPPPPDPTTPKVTTAPSSFTGTAVPEERRRVLLAPLTHKPGDVIPGDTWLEGVRQLWSECLLATLMPQFPTSTVCSPSSEQFCTYIRDLAGKAVEGLIARAQSLLPTQSWTDRLRIHNETTREIFFDGQILEVESIKAYTILRHLIEKKGGPVSTKDLQKLPGCNTQINKILRLLPTQLREIVKNNGSRAGYFLQLPPKCP